MPVVPLRVRVPHRVLRLFRHVAGIEVGSLIYLDLNAYAWYDGSAGFETRPGPGISINRYLKGVEDNDQRKVQ
ncbi:hypothetical protein [Meiothermus sp.]|uniref:hypothetical protein n=1 Tax=Meiothermus sp. TaxID=1955249 RepID=UPI0021DD24E3|nr:hypothetical protein [Meiothermus sp.]GIW25789.1 MAG: hypothetical protein KatS3mg069_2056 [Meiothermus sp.]